MDEAKETQQIRRREANIGEEFRDSFDVGGIQQRYMEMAAQQLEFTNPLRILELFENAPDDLKQDALQRIRVLSNAYLDNWKTYMEAGADVPANLMAVVSEVVKKKLEDVKR